MNLARSTFYHQPKKKSTSRETFETSLRDRIENLCLQFPRYGYRRITKQLQKEGWKVNHKRVERIMREESLQCQVKKRWIKTTDSNHSFKIYPNLLEDFGPTGINQAWVSDITYIRLLTEFVYLAVILDLYSRKVIGWAMSRHIDTKLTLGALQMALEDRNPPAGCIHHSDRGVQYAAGDYVNALKTAEMRISMSAKGNPYDNAVAESFMKTLKVEEVYLAEYRNLEDAVRKIGYFLEDVYNQKRLHSSLDYQSPAEFERELGNRHTMDRGRKAA